MTNNPKEYIHLPSGPNNNVAYYHHTKTQYGICETDGTPWEERGTTKFAKVALDIQVN